MKTCPRCKSYASYAWGDEYLTGYDCEACDLLFTVLTMPDGKQHITNATDIRTGKLVKVDEFEVKVRC